MALNNLRELNNIQQSGRSAKSSNKMDKLLYMQFCQSKQAQVFVKLKDQIYSKKTYADDDIKEMKHEIDHGIKNTADDYLERYTTQILDSMEKN